MNGSRLGSVPDKNLNPQYILKYSGYLVSVFCFEEVLLIDLFLNSPRAVRKRDHLKRRVIKRRRNGYKASVSTPLSIGAPALIFPSASELDTGEKRVQERPFVKNHHRQVRCKFYAP